MKMSLIFDIALGGYRTIWRNFAIFGIWIPIASNKFDLFFNEFLNSRAEALSILIPSDGGIASKTYKIFALFSPELISKINFLNQAQWQCSRDNS